MKVIMQVRTKFDNQNLKYPKKRTSLIEFSREETPNRIFPRDIEILSRCPAGSVLPHGIDVLHLPASHPIFSYWVG